jgi:hypothetical protein
VLTVATIESLKPGDIVDLSGDLFADFDRSNAWLEEEYVTVESVEAEGVLLVMKYHSSSKPQLTWRAYFSPNHCVRKVQ